MLTHYSWETVNADIAAAYDTLKWKPETTASYAQIDGSKPFSIKYLYATRSKFSIVSCGTSDE